MGSGGGTSVHVVTIQGTHGVTIAGIYSNCNIAGLYVNCIIAGIHIVSILGVHERTR